MTETYSAPDKRRPPEPRVPAPATAKRTATAHSKAATDLLDDVSTERLRADVAALAAFHTRHTFSTHISAAADHLVARFHSLGHPGAGKRAWTRLGHTGQNVVAIKPGVAPAPRTVILGAHYDSRMQTASDATSRAPGADDNASGVAAVLEIARLLGGVDLVDTVHFVCFSGEEQGLWGSTEYAAQLEADGVGVHWMINLDMIGHPPADDSVTVERDTGNAVHGNDSASLALGAVMSQAATDYTTLPVMLGPIYSSDYMPFEARGWVTVGAYEGEGNPHYHQTSDDVGTVDYSYLTQVTRMVLATLLQALPGGPIATGADMAPGEVLYAGQSVSSANSRYVFVYQTDGNLVLYGPAGALWASNTNGAPVGVAIMQGDGNLVIYGPGGTVVWASNTDGNPGARLVVQDDGNVVIYRTDGSPAWDTGTWLPTGPIASGDDMAPGEVLNPGQSISSANIRYVFTYQTDGNLVLYGPAGALWASNTNGAPVGVAIMQGDGNLVIYGPGGTVVWASNTAGNPGARLVVQDDGNVVIYRTDGSAAWDTGTWLPTGPSASGDDMSPGEVLDPGDSIRSADGRYTLVYQGDANLVLYGPAGALWASNTNGAPVGVAIMQGDGNLVIYGPGGSVVWASNTDGNPGARLVVQDDGNVVIYRIDGSPAWDTGTWLPTGPSATGDDMAPGEVLNPGQSISSADGRYVFVYQGDGNLVLYGPAGALWASNTNGQPVGVAIMQGDGNLVIYGPGGSVVWASNTDGNPGARLVVQDDGNVVIYRTDGIARWATIIVHV